MALLTTDPEVLVWAVLSGILPSLLWLWFWLKEDEENPEPSGLLAIVFIMGAAAVMVVLPIQKFIQGHIVSEQTELILWASAEEMIKYLAVLILLYGTKNADEPVDWPIYLIAAAVGFAALENILFLIKPLSTSGTTVSMLTGQLRYLGSTLLHTVASGVIGISIGLSFFMGELGKKVFLLFGFVAAVALHSAFNFFIIRNNGDDYMKVFAFLWVVTILVLLLFEKVRRMSQN